jgi:hypothetical protein
MGPTYATREAAKAAWDLKLTARDDARVDRALASATASTNDQLHWAHFHPVVATRYFDWPNRSYADAGRLWLDNQGLITLTSITTGGDTIAPGSVLLEPVNEGPPFDRIELDLDTSASFGGATGRQQNIAITGVWGYRNTTVPAGALAETLDNSETGVDVTDSSAIGVGSLITCESERMVATAKSLLDSGQNLGTNLTAQQNAELVNLTSGAAFHTGEVITIDAEQMLLVDIAGNNGVVKRAWNGSTLAAHTAPADIYVPRTLTVERGACGTTAANHLTATALTVWQAPPLVESLCIAEATVLIQQELAAYGRTVGSGENERESAGKGLLHIRSDAATAHGRTRLGAI